MTIKMLLWQLRTNHCVVSLLLFEKSIIWLGITQAYHLGISKTSGYNWFEPLKLITAPCKHCAGDFCSGCFALRACANGITSILANTLCYDITQGCANNLVLLLKQCFCFKKVIMYFCYVDVKQEWNKLQCRLPYPVGISILWMQLSILNYCNGHWPLMIAFQQFKLNIDPPDRSFRAEKETLSINQIYCPVFNL